MHDQGKYLGPASCACRVAVPGASFVAGSRDRVGVRSRGFTLIELVVVIIILGVLAAVAVPKFIDMSRTARVAAVKSMGGTVWTAASSVHAMCGLTPQCDYANQYQVLTIAGRPSARVNFGWPEAGDNVNLDGIDVWVVQSDFIVNIPDTLHTLFALSGAPDPLNCAVLYQQAYPGVGPDPAVTLLTSGC